MKNSGLFGSLFIKKLKESSTLSETAQGRMATLAHAWRQRRDKGLEELWESFMKQALGYLEFVPANKSNNPGVYPLYEDYSYKKCISVLFLVSPGYDIDTPAVGQFYPAKLLAHLNERNLNWGILTDGSRWRLYSTRSSRPYEDYVELLLAETLVGFDEAEYGLFERFFHRDSFVASLHNNELAVEAYEYTKEAIQSEQISISKCRLDQDRDQSEQTLEELVKKPFLAQVDEVLQYICNGFIFDTHKSGEEYTEAERAEIFESAVKMIYRCLFLFYAEARRLLPTDPTKTDLYRQHSIQALCREAHAFRWGKRHDTDQYDLWKHLKGLINAVNDGDPEYGIMGYDGGLFDDQRERFLGHHKLRNDFLSRALYLLAFVEPYEDESEEEYPIPYEDLEVRHLGELYENILEYTVQLADADRIRRRTKKGVEILLAKQTTKKAGDTLIKRGDVYFGESALERKQTGSYYTPETLVRFLNKKTIIQPLAEIFDRKYRQRLSDLLEQARSAHDLGTRRGAAQSAAALIEHFVENELFQFKICDPAMGSGHFLVDASNEIADFVISLLAEVPFIEGMNISITSYPNDWRRLITRHCIYGVDLNPLAVDLAKLSLWLNCFATHHKLTFLDHHLRCGNSLVGIYSVSQLSSIPVRVKKESTKKNNRDSENLILPFDYNDLSNILNKAVDGITSITRVDEDDTDFQKAIFDEALSDLSKLQPLADLYSTYLMEDNITPKEYSHLFEYHARGHSTAEISTENALQLLTLVKEYRLKHKFYHWPLEFPEVFGPSSKGGFSAIIGNPPWDKLKPNLKEFFSCYYAGFRSYSKNEAERISKQLMRENSDIFKSWQKYCEAIQQVGKYVRGSGDYKNLGKGDIDLFKLFLEQSFRLIRKSGGLGVVIPGSFYVNQGCMPLRKLFFNKSQIKFLYAFENQNPKIFQGVLGNKIILLMGLIKGLSTKQFMCAFGQHNPEILPKLDNNALSMDVNLIKKFSPDDLGIIEFNSQVDIDIITKIYCEWPCLGEKIDKSWNVKFRGELHASKFRHIFKETPTDWRLYIGEEIWHFDHMFNAPSFWVDREEALKVIPANARWEVDCYRLGYRDIAWKGNQRSLISTIIPPSFHTNKLPTVTPYKEGNTLRGPNNTESLWLASVLSSFVLDFVIRNKIMETLNFFLMYSLPVPRISPSSPNDALWIYKQVVARAARLICVNHEFASLWEGVYQDIWKDSAFWYPDDSSLEYGPAHEIEIRREIKNSVLELGPEWNNHCALMSRNADRRDMSDRAQFRAEIDALIAHIYKLEQTDIEYILDKFPVLKSKEEKAFGEFISKRKVIEEYVRFESIIKKYKNN